MINRTIVPATIIAVLSSGPAFAEAPLCALLAKEYDHANKALASNVVNFARSAPQQTVRELVTMNARLRQVIALQQMAGHKCRLPMAISSASIYFTDALNCSLVSKTKPKATECDRDTWRAKK